MWKSSAAGRIKLQMIIDCCPNKYGQQPLYLYSSGPTALTDTNYNCPPRIKKNQYYKSDDKALRNIMVDPRVCRGIYGMDLGNHVDEEPFYPCFEMIKKDPMCKLYLRRINKKCSAKKEFLTVFKKAKESKDLIIDAKSEQSLASSPSKKLEKVHKKLQGKSNGCQTDQYYELINEEIIFVEQEVQTDAQSDLDFSLLARETVQKSETGDDKDTQICPGDWDLFDFNVLVEPAVLNCANAVIEQALLELMSETELEMLINQQRAYEYRKNLELSRLKRLQECRQAIISEPSKKIQSEKERMEQTIEAGQAISSSMFAKYFLSNILEATIDGARKEGVFRSQEDSSPFISWLEDETFKENNKTDISRKILDDIIGYSLFDVQVEQDNLQPAPSEEAEFHPEPDWNDEEMYYWEGGQ